MRIEADDRRRRRSTRNSAKSTRPFVLTCLLFSAVVAVGAGAAFAQAGDPHALYEQRCGKCHSPHAGAFVAESLERRDGKVVGRDSGRELRAFLARGHGRLASDDVDVMVAHLTSILAAGGLFREKCLICHGRAKELARLELILRDGRVTGRYSGRDIAVFLAGHGRLEPDEVPTIVLMLERQLAHQ